MSESVIVGVRLDNSAIYLCSKCEHEIVVGAKYCHNCGTLLNYINLNELAEHKITYRGKKLKFKYKSCGKVQNLAVHWVTLNCSNCGREVTRRTRDINYNIKRNKDGVVRVFCKKKCRDKYLKTKYRVE